MNFTQSSENGMLSGLNSFADTVGQATMGAVTWPFYKMGMMTGGAVLDWKYNKNRLVGYLVIAIVAALLITLLAGGFGAVAEGMGGIKGRKNKASMMEGFGPTAGWPVAGYGNFRAAPGQTIKGYMGKRGTNALPGAMTRSFGPQVMHGGRNVPQVIDRLARPQEVTNNIQASSEGALKYGEGIRNGFETVADLKDRSTRSRVVTGAFSGGKGAITKGGFRYINPAQFELTHAAAQGAEHTLQQGEWARAKALASEGMRQISKNELKKKYGQQEGMSSPGGVPHALAKSRKAWDPERRRRGLTSASARALAGGCNLNAVWDETTDFYRSQFGFPVGYIDDQTGHCVTAPVNNLVGAGGADLVTEPFGNSATGIKRSGQYAGRGGNVSGHQQRYGNPGYYA